MFGSGSRWDWNCDAYKEGKVNVDYITLFKQKNSEKVALIEDGIPFTYGEVVKRAIDLSRDTSVFLYKDNQPQEKIHIVRRKKISEQLIEFLACNEIGIIPVIVPYDVKILPDTETENIPENVCMAVMTSGTTGAPKLLYRTYESWAGFFDIQNEIFEIKEDSRMFAQGSLAFTGNLNLYMGIFYAGGTVVAQNAFQPKKWRDVIEKEKVSVIYLIPSKLMCLLKVMDKPNRSVKKILSGSQSLGKEDAEKLKKIFVNTGIILYYGASELNYITYVTDREMNDQKNLIGKPFPEVGVFVKDDNIYVNTKYHVTGITCPYSLSDCGYMDNEGNLYFTGRSDDIINIRGRKVSSYRIENELLKCDVISEAAVIFTKEKKGEFLTAFVCLEKNKDINILSYQNSGIFTGEVKSDDLFGELRQSLAHYEMPSKIVVLNEMPKSESGKNNKRKISDEWSKIKL